ncbi:MAG: N-acetyltransferase family protein [Bacteroidia bacterium]
MEKDFRIRPGTIEEAVAISQLIPEFVDPYGEDMYEKRFTNVSHIILVAELQGGEIIGFKSGYERDSDGSFYSWMGGVKPAWRQEGVARSLAHGMEVWARANGYHTFRFKTRNCHRAMLHFALNNEFNVIGFEEAEEVSQHRIWFEKKL